MPRSTFFSLKAEKRERIEKALVSEFENRTLGDAKVKHVVERLGISRGSFYQYFHNMQDAYFYILDLKLRFIHEGFFTLYRAEPQNIESVLEKYGVFLRESLYAPEHYPLFRNRFMAWNSELEMAWRQYHADEAIGAFYSNPRFVLIGDLVHGLMQRVFMHRLSPDAFSKDYDEMVRFVMGGVKNV
ncbi:TetR/AcrR family transcriptional regulator [Aedoeadaptatus coxii]|uniref:TetR/AcrR family transcriptional regulator n=1 Tax=Aedoeadaptatus coxii TaxID=755172 RepID=UPI00083855E0|nr:TetR/AcrR family transcriptional regulator [Peptoniphilus coxii]